VKNVPLSWHEQWMVRSNLQRIADGETTAEQNVLVLRANGYNRIADEVARRTAA
jgi:hypothetical protein